MKKENYEDTKFTKETSSDDFDLADANGNGLTNKQKKNLEDIANKYYQQASELTFDNLILNQKVTYQISSCNN